jgi:hypothetical protein
VPKFTYTGDNGRYYPDLALTVDDGDEVEFDEAPVDGRWSPSKSAPSASSAPTTSGVDNAAL